MVVVVIAAVIVTLTVTGGDDQAVDPNDSGSVSSSDSSSASDSVSDSVTDSGSDSASPTDDPSPVDVPDGAIAGHDANYYFTPPGPAWNDAYEEAATRGLGPTLDSFIVLGKNIALAQSNILVEEVPVGTDATVEDLADQWKRNLSGSDGATPTDIDDIILDGEHAIGVTFSGRVNDSNIEFDQRVYLAVHDGQEYSVALSYPSSGDNVSNDDFDTFLDSWHWTS
ncbi:hypothetical protein BH11ACT8_BH11ACT8_21560 [soil metagenome]